jgi:phosphoglycolate phosphatase-like HAD superfamily hydrolase
MGLQPSEVVFVGDFEFDMLSGRRAGVWTVLLRSGATTISEHADLGVDSFAELQEWLTARNTKCRPHEST